MAQSILRFAVWTDDGLAVERGRVSDVSKCDFVRDERGRLMRFFNVDFDSVSFLYCEPVLLPSGLPSLGKTYPLEDK